VTSDPMQQFQIKEKAELFEIFGHTISWTNSAFWMVVSAILIVIFFALTTKRKLIPGKMQSMGELSYEFIANMVKDTTGPEAMKFMPFIFTLFFFILAANLVGMNPYAFPITLAVRLFANMVAGHVMLKLFAIFAAFLVAKGGVYVGAAILPIFGVMAIAALEFLVAALQAFVFAILTCIYLNDVYHVHH